MGRYQHMWPCKQAAVPATSCTNPNHRHRSKYSPQSTNNKPPQAPDHSTASPKPLYRMSNTIAEHTHTHPTMQTPRRPSSPQKNAPAKPEAASQASPTPASVAGSAPAGTSRRGTSGGGTSEDRSPLVTPPTRRTIRSRQAHIPQTPCSGFLCAQTHAPHSIHRSKRTVHTGKQPQLRSLYPNTHPHTCRNLNASTRR